MTMSILSLRCSRSLKIFAVAASVAASAMAAAEVKVVLFFGIFVSEEVEAVVDSFGFAASSPSWGATLEAIFAAAASSSSSSSSSSLSTTNFRFLDFDFFFAALLFF